MQKEYGSFQMGIQSYSLRNFKTPEALEITQSLGLQHWEAFMAHIPLTESTDAMREYHQALRARRVKLIAYGVVGFNENEEAARRLFTFAKQMGIQVLTADPDAASLRYLGKLVEEFKIPIAIHNHGPGSRYDKIDDVWKAMQGQPARIGACVDTGHFLRSGEDPVEAIRRFGERTFGVHLKDVKDRTQFPVLGKGDLDVRGTLSALKKAKFRHCLALEYEENPSNPIRDLEECLNAVKEAAKKL